jgi:class 3 adenylate cyclase
VTESPVTRYATAPDGVSIAYQTVGLFATTLPHRVTSLAWFHPIATRRWSPEYPWGLTPEELRKEAVRTRDLMGDQGAMGEWLAGAAPWLRGDERLHSLLARLDRHFMAPSTALEWIAVESETDVTAILPLVRCPTVLIDHDDASTDSAEARHIQRLMPGSELALLGGERAGLVFSDLAAVTDVVRGAIDLANTTTTPKSILGSVLFTDIVGSTERLASIGDQKWTELLAQHHVLVRAAIGRWGGVEHDTAGDSFYATFDGPARAIRCARDIVERIQALGLEIRAGIHAGELEYVDGKYAGLAVAIGARIAATAGRSEVLISRTVKDLTAGSGFDLEDRGVRELKGVSEAMHLYRVLR